MQTPGRAIEPQTSMIPLERRIDSAYERMLVRVQDGTPVERPQIRGLGRVVLEMEQLNNNMKSIQSEIQSDIRARRKYFEEEQKLLKKDIQQQQGFQTGALFDLRKIIGLASFGIAANELAQGDIAGAAQGIGLGTAAFLPEIAQGVIGILAARGLIGGAGGALRGSGMVAGGLGMLGGGKAKGILALAALGGLLLTGSALASNDSDSRRRQNIIENVKGDDTINAPDVVRFRSQLTKADAILGSVKDTTPEKTSGGDNTLNLDSVEEQVAKLLTNPMEGAKPADAPTAEVEKKSAIVPKNDVIDDKSVDQKVGFFNRFFGSPAQAGTLDEFIAQGGVLPDQSTFDLTGASQDIIGDDVEFIEAIKKVSKKRQINPAELLGLIASESSLDPKAFNEDSGAAGLIQFLPKVAEDLGTNTDEILKMSRAQQVDLIDKYFEMNKLPNNPTAGQLKTNVLMPFYTDESDDFELMTKFDKFTDGQQGFPNVFDVNKGLDYNKDGFVTIGEAGESITRKMDEFGILDLTNMLSDVEKKKVNIDGKSSSKNQWWDFMDLFPNKKEQSVEPVETNKSSTEPVIINEGGKIQEMTTPPPVPNNATGDVNVSTIFEGSIDKLESAYSLKTYAAFG